MGTIESPSAHRQCTGVFSKWEDSGTGGEAAQLSSLPKTADAHISGLVLQGAGLGEALLFDIQTSS